MAEDLDVGYGFTDDKTPPSAPRLKFGLNAGKTFLTKFEFNPHAGANNSEQEAIDVEFTIDGTKRSDRFFPVVKAFKKDRTEVTDRNAPEFQDAVRELNMMIIHILKCFKSEEDIKAALSRKIPDFKTYAEVVMGILPRDFSQKPLDIFLQWQWQIGKDKDRTYLEVPNKMKHGLWLCPAIKGEWTERKVPNPDDDVEAALYYVNEKGQTHPFIRSGWFMNHEFAHQQKNDDKGSSSTVSMTNSPVGGTPRPASNW